MTNQEKAEIIEKLIGQGYTDLLDVNPGTSYFEYGIARNPVTNHVLYCLNGDSDIPLFDYTYVTIDDMREALNEQPKGFFNFIGSDLKTEVENLNNNYLSNLIHSMNQYSGYWQQSCLWQSEVDF